MAKKPSLNAALHEAAGKKSVTPEPPKTTASTVSPQLDASIVPPSRQGKKVIAGYFDPAVSKQLRQLALEHDTTVQALLAEALNLLFEKHGKSSIAGRGGE